MSGYAARYSRDIERDLARGFSFAGWAFHPEQTEAAALDAARAYGWSDPEAAYSDELGGWLPCLRGLSAYYDADEEEAIYAAEQDERFRDVPLWVFPAEYLAADEDAQTIGGLSAAIVRPVGPARRVS